MYFGVVDELAAMGQFINQICFGADVWSFHKMNIAFGFLQIQATELKHYLVRQPELASNP